MRFFDTDPRPLHISELRAGLREIDPAFDIDGGFLLYDTAWYAEITIDPVGSDYFESEVRSILADVTEGSGAGQDRVLKVLHDAKQQICLRVLYGGRDPEATLSRLDVLWDWLFTHRSGLLHAEGEGFYQDDELILAVK